MKERINLPAGWLWSRLGEVCLDPQYGWTTSAKTEGALHLLRTTDITSGNIDWNTVPFCNEEPSEKEKYLLKDGDIVISRAGSVGYSHLIKNPKEAIFASYLIRFRSLIYEKYFSYFLKSPFYWNSISEKSLGIAIPNVNASKLKQIFIPLPPLPEQRAIASKIEQLFSDLDNGIENFKKAQAQLKLYRQSVLKAACEGKLVPTEAELARAEGRRDYEAADVLLTRILKERREKLGKDGKYKEPAAQDTNGLSELPEGWCLANVRMISEKIQYGTSEKAGEDNSGIPVLRMGNIQDGKLNLDNLKYFPKDWSELSDYILQDGDVLFNRTNSAELVGKTSVYKKHHPPAVFASYLIRVRVIENAYNPDLLSFFINSIFGRKYIGSVVSQQVGQANVNGTKLSQMPIPLPPLAEQRRIVAEVERRLSISDKLEATMAESLLKAESLRRSILKKAFEGKLLNEKELEKARNASDWEPAEKLLERIRQEKQINEKNNEPTGRNTHG